MRKIQNSQIGNFAGNLKDFRSFSATGINIDNKFYVVKSYDTLILNYDIENKKVLFFDNSFFSVTTSRLQNILKDVFQLDECEKRQKYEF